MTPVTAETRALLRRALATPRANTATGAGLIAAAVLLFALVRWIDNSLSSLPDAATLPLGVLLVCALVFAGLVLLARPARHGLRQAALVGAGAYLFVGLVLLATGIPGYVPSGKWYLVAMWPMLVLWLHACTLGAGLWPCPPG